MIVERLAVHFVGHDHFSWMKSRIDLTQRQYRPVSVRSGRDDVFCQRLASQVAAERRAYFGQQILETHSRISFVGIGMQIVNRDRDVGMRSEVSQL